jgi:hypothetical protein
VVHACCVRCFEGLVVLLMISCIHVHGMALLAFGSIDGSSGTFFLDLSSSLTFLALQAAYHTVTSSDWVLSCIMS